MVEQGTSNPQHDALAESTHLPLTPEEARWWRLDEVYGRASVSDALGMRSPGSSQTDSAGERRQTSTQLPEELVPTSAEHHEVSLYVL